MDKPNRLSVQCLAREGHRNTSTPASGHRRHPLPQGGRSRRDGCGSDGCVRFRAGTRPTGARPELLDHLVVGNGIHSCLVTTGDAPAAVSAVGHQRQVDRSPGGFDHALDHGKIGTFDRVFAKEPLKRPQRLGRTNQKDRARRELVDPVNDADIRSVQSASAPDIARPVPAECRVPGQASAGLRDRRVCRPRGHRGLRTARSTAARCFRVAGSPGL